MSDLTNRLRKGFDFLCREKQIDSYQAISNEAADKIDGLEAENLAMQNACGCLQSMIDSSSESILNIIPEVI
jgi:hypothetical protein